MRFFVRSFFFSSSFCACCLCLFPVSLGFKNTIKNYFIFIQFKDERLTKILLAGKISLSLSLLNWIKIFDPVQGRETN